MVARVYSQKQCTRGHFLRILTYPYPFSFNNCDSNRYEVILLCSSDLHFPDFCDVEHLFIYPLTICMVVCFFFKCLFSSSAYFKIIFTSEVYEYFVYFEH